MEKLDISTLHAKQQRCWRAILNLFGIGDKEPNPEEMSFPVARTLIILSTVMAITLIASNLAALKIWDFLSIPVDGGIWLFPISYAVGDLLVDIYGKKVANLVAVSVSAMALVTAATLWFVKFVLPDFAGVDNGAFVVVQSATGRIFLASVAGFLVSQLVNNSVFVKIRKNTIDDTGIHEFRKREIVSSAIARVPDSLIFETLAFFGRVSLAEFFSQTFFALLMGIIIETMFSGVVAKQAVRLRYNLKYSDGKKE